MNDIALRRYRQDAADAIVPCVLDDITLLYHRASGQTHMVISPVPEIIEAIDQSSGASAEEVHARLARHYDLSGAVDAVLEIEAHLEGLVALGLIRRA